ncbi:MAG: hypothetical protein KUG73_05830 [Pseudomonadales bacterium]|nr:hypothetical protein [Pseudomonadales bacterium]
MTEDSKGEFIKVTDVENLLVSLCDNIMAAERDYQFSQDAIDQINSAFLKTLDFI